MIRALDLELLRGIGFSLVMFVFLLYFFKMLLFNVKPKGTFWKNLQANMKGPCLFLLVLAPAANLCYWLAVLMKYYVPLKIGVMLVLTIMLLEIFLTSFYTMAGVLSQKTWFDRTFSITRIIIYSTLVYFSYSRFILHQLNDGGFFLASCWSVLVFCILNFGYETVFKRINYGHALLSMLVKRLRWWGMAMVILLTLEYALTWLDKAPKILFSNLQVAIAFMIGVGIIEAVLVGIFQYYFEYIRKRPVSKLFQDLTRIVVYIILGLAVLGAVFREGLSSLLVSSTIFSVILGLALQETLGNFFAGLSLSVSKPYRTGDYIDISGQVGKVSKIDWRSTVLLTVFGESVIFPNSVLAKSTIKNYSQPADIEGRIVEVGVDYKHSPDLVRRVLLEAAAAAEGVEPRPAPRVFMMDFADSAIIYRLKYWIPDFASYLEIDSRVRESIWYHFSRNNLNIPFPIRTVLGGDNAVPVVQMADGCGGRSAAAATRSLSAGSHLALAELKAILSKYNFLSVSDEYLSRYADRLAIKLYGPGEKFRMSANGADTIYVIARGSASLEETDEKGNKLAEIGRGGTFGSFTSSQSDGKASFTAQAKEECAVIELVPECMPELFADNWQELWDNYMSGICVPVAAEPVAEMNKAEESEQPGHESGGILSAISLGHLNL